MKRAIRVTSYSLLFLLSLFVISCLELIEKEEGDACVQTEECGSDLLCEDSVCIDPFEEHHRCGFVLTDIKICY